MKNRLSYLALVALFAGTTSYAQNKIKGAVYSAENTTAMYGVEVYVKGTADGVVTNEDGSFTLSTEMTEGQIEIASMGYVTRSVRFNFHETNEVDLGAIYLNEDNESLDEVVVMARGVIDVADGRRTPIAVSTIKGADIEDKVGSSDITATMVNTPSVYVTSQSSGFGDTQMYTRGFDQSNTAFLLNGQPINGMEDGNMYWSNWSGMADIANAIQIQRGLGSSKLAISSVGGTINFITKATEMHEGGFLKAGVANDDYYKATAGYSTGLMDNGWGVTALFSHWQGDGYNDMTQGQGQSYFVSIGYKANEKHNFNFLITGAPQWHNQNFAKSISSYQEFGKKYNNNWGYLNGERITDRKNYYHKPVMNLNWDWKINDVSSLSTVVYASFGRGGGTGSLGSAYAKYMDDGTKGFQELYDNNVAAGESSAVIRASVNNHAWFGMVSNYNRDLGNNFKLNAGIDLRSYHGDHFQQLVNLLGGDHYIDKVGSRLRDPNASISDTFTTNPWGVISKFAKNPDQKVAYDYSETIRYGGVFGQLEYATDRFSAFFQGAVSDQSHVRVDPFQYSPAEEESEKVNNVGYNVKGGLSYNVDNKHFFFGNAGFYSRQPYHDNIYISYGNTVNPYTKNEEIVGLELGYKFVSEYVQVNVNAYRTTWANRVESSVRTVGPNETTYPEYIGQQLFTVNRGVKQNHKGIELDVQAKPLYNLEVSGFASIGDWRYKGSVVSEIRTEGRDILDTTVRSIDNGKVGNAAQTTFGLGAKYKIIPNLSVDANYRYYQDLYANVQEAEGDNIKLPSFGLFDAGVSYALNLSPKNRLSFRVNVNNLFDTEYISQSNTATKVDNTTTATYKGLDVRNQVYFGYGRTWNASVKFTF